MIIWGSRGRRSVKGTGEFFCGNCGDYRPYKHMKMSKWFTLYFIPLFPTSDLGEHIECGHCSSTFNMSALNYDPRKQKAQAEELFVETTLKLMIKIADVDGDVSNSEIDQIQKYHEEIGGNFLSQTEIAEMRHTLSEEGQSAVDYCAQIADLLENTGRETALRGAIKVSKADGYVDVDEVTMLHEMSEALGFPKAYANGIFVEEGIRVAA